MNFSEALDAMKRGEKVARKGWDDFTYLYIDKEDNAIGYHSRLTTKNGEYTVACLASDTLLSNDWVIRIDTPKTGDIVQLKGMGKGIITKCRVDGKYAVLIGDGNFLVCDMFNFDLTGENRLELVDDIKDFLY